MRRFLFALVGSLVVSAAACGGAGDSRDGEGGSGTTLAELRERRHEMLLQFMSAQAPIRETQAKALEEPGVRAVQRAFYNLLRERMIRDDPQAAELLDRAARVGAELDRLSRPIIIQPGDTTTHPATQEEKQRVARELGEIEKALRPLQEKALADSAVAAAFETLQDSVVAAILRIDPTAKEALDRMHEIEKQISEIDRQIARREEG